MNNNIHYKIENNVYDKVQNKVVKNIWYQVEEHGRTQVLDDNYNLPTICYNMGKFIFNIEMQSINQLKYLLLLEDFT